MTRKTGLTFERHEQLAIRLQFLREELGELCVLLGRSYSRKLVYKLGIWGCYRAIDHIRSEMEELLFKEHPNRADTRIYYPGQTHQAAFKEVRSILSESSGGWKPEVDDPNKDLRSFSSLVELMRESKGE